MRWVSNVPGAQALNAFFAGLHPLELQHVLPHIAAAEEVLLSAQPKGHPMLPEGREAILLDPGDESRGWTMSRSTEQGSAPVVDEGKREHLVWLARLAADVVLGSLANPAPDLPWVRPIRTARDALLGQRGEDFIAVRPQR